MNKQTDCVTYLWHDYETFGLHTRSDRPAQFAAVRTDEHFNVVEPEMCWYCRPSLDYLPSPQSIAITGITPQQCLHEGMTEAQFAKQIDEAMTKASTVSIGYNSMRFDDEVTRFLLWRNFRDSYAREWMNNCSRFDLFPLVLATWALRPNGINWPKKEDGKTSFRLEHLTKANGLDHEKAHDALSDVYATMAVAQLIQEKQPKLWEYALKNRTKYAVQTIFEKSRTSGPVLWVNVKFGSKNGFMKLVAPLGTHPTQKNKLLVWDLAYDPTELVGLTTKDIRERLFLTPEARESGLQPLPIHICPINQAPFVVGQLGVLTDERAQLFGIDKALALENYDKMPAVTEMMLGAWFEAFNDEIKGIEDIDAALYSEPFATPQDKRLSRWISEATPKALADWVEDGKDTFDNERYREKLFRYRARNWPESLSASEQERWRVLCRQRLEEGLGGVLTLEAFAQELSEMEEQAQVQNDEQLEEICGALNEWMEMVHQHLDPY